MVLDLLKMREKNGVKTEKGCSGFAKTSWAGKKVIIKIHLHETEW